MSYLLIIKFATLEKNIESAIEYNGNRISIATTTIPMALIPGSYARNYFQGDPLVSIGNMEIGKNFIVNDYYTPSPDSIGNMEIGNNFIVSADYYKDLQFFTANDLRLNKREQEIVLYYLTLYDLNTIIVI